MQHLNDDMDELFRKAADDYPLNTGTPDWNKIAEGLSQEKTPDLPVKTSYRKFTWLLLLLPLVFLCNRIYNPGLFRQTSEGNSVETETRETGENQSLEDQKSAILENENSSDNNKPAADITVNPNSAADLTVGQEKNLKAGEIPQSQGDKSRLLKNDYGLLAEAPEVSNVQQGGLYKQSKFSKNKTSRNKNPSGLNPGINAISPDPKLSVVSDGISADAFTKILLVPFNMEPDVTTVPIPDMTKVLPGPATKQRIKNKNVYLGLAGGLDFTTVSFQQTSKVGNHFGAIAGYSFRKKWSVELGFFVDKKHYYTDPKYFEKGKLPYRTNTTIISVDGSCSMFEIPVSVKYDITNTYKSNLFVTGGLSSYIMKNEDYTIVYQYNSSGSRAPHPYSYKHSSTNFLAEVRITGGYALKLPKSFSIRVEPYLNIPVSGVGRGNLNLMSAGLNAGVFKRIF